MNPSIHLIPTEFPCASLTYELIVVEGLQMRDNLKPILSRTAAAPPFMINPSDLGGVETAGKVFTFGVRSKSKEVGFESD